MNGFANPAVMTSIPKTDKPAEIDPEPATAEPKVAVRHLNFHYGAHQVLDDISLTVAQNKITALIGPSGCKNSISSYIRNETCSRHAARDPE